MPADTNDSRPPLVVGFDDSRPGFDALELARLGASELGGRVEVVRVVEVESAWMRVPHDDAEIVAVEAETRRTVARRFEGVDHDVRVQLGSAAETLDEIAEAGGAAGIVLGASHHGTAGRFFLGSVAEALLQGAPCPVAVAPRDYSRRRGNTLQNKITVGYDGGDESRAAAHAAAEIAHATGAKLEIVAAIRPLALSPTRGPYLATVREAVAGQVERIAAELRERVEVEAGWTEGEPVPTLVGASADTDLLVVGSRGYGPVRRALLGSVSRGLVHASESPVLVWPRLIIR